MRVLLDSDIFCKVGVAGLVSELPRLFGVPPTDLRILASLRYVLRDGSLSRPLDPGHAQLLRAVAASLPVLEDPPVAALSRFTGITDIDPGEALMLASAWETDDLFLTGDKRALGAVARESWAPPGLDRRIV